MRPTFRLYGTHVYKPLIRFLGRRTSPTTPHPPHPHPAAPPEVASRFSDFLKKFNSSSQTPSASVPYSSATGNTAGPRLYYEYWEAPSQYWAPSREIDEIEIEAVLSGGASRR